MTGSDGVILVKAISNSSPLQIITHLTVNEDLKHEEEEEEEEERLLALLSCLANNTEHTSIIDPFLAYIPTPGNIPKQESGTQRLHAVGSPEPESCTLAGFFDPVSDHQLWFYRSDQLNNPYTTADIDTFNELGPLLAQTLRVVVLNSKVQQLEGRISQIQSWPYPVALADSDGTILTHNTPFKKEIGHAKQTKDLSRFIRDWTRQISNTIPDQGENGMRNFSRFGRRTYQVVGVPIENKELKKRSHWLLRFERISDIDSRMGRRLYKARLTDRELEIAGRMMEGQNNRQIAATLSISYHTVRTHVKKVYQKLGVNSVSALTNVQFDMSSAIEYSSPHFSPGSKTIAQD